MTARHPHFAFLLTALLTCLPAAHAGENARERERADVLSAQQVRAATGKTIEQWGARWWQWAYDNPEVLGDTTGEFGPLGDVGGPVFFALGSGGMPTVASYEVPGGQYILLPVATYLWTFFDPCARVACARRIVNRNFIEGITYVSVQVDGEWVPNMFTHLVRVDDNDPLVFKVDAGPIVDGYGGILRAVQGGYWVMLKPLSPGKHRISMLATVPNLNPETGEVVAGYTDLDAKLRLSVRPRR